MTAQRDVINETMVSDVGLHAVVAVQLHNSFSFQLSLCAY